MAKTAQHSQAQFPPARIGWVLGSGLALSLILFMAVQDWEQRELEASAAGAVREQVEKLQISALRSMEVLHSIGAFYTANGGIDRAQFRQFVDQALARQPELQALSWNPLVSAVHRQRLELAAQKEYATNFVFTERDASGQFVPAARRDEYVPVYYIEPLARNLGALGYDLSSDTRRRESLERARATGKPTATGPIHLAQESGQQSGFLVLMPVYQPGQINPENEATRTLAGFAVAVFRVGDLVNAAFQKLQQAGIALRVYDEAVTGELIYQDALLDAPIVGEENIALTPLHIAGRQWIVAFAPTEKFIAARSQYQSWVVLTGGLAFTLLATAYLYGGWRRSQEIAKVNLALQEEVGVRQKAEAEAEAANEAKSDFLASMSHEIRTPLNAILGYTQLMQRDPQLAGEQRDAIGGISASGHHLLGLINEILDLSKIEAGRMELHPMDFDLNSLGKSLEKTFQPLCVQKRVNFRWEINPPEQGRVRGDEGKLRQVLINLLGNAVKFTNSGEVYLRFKQAVTGQWCFEVIDTGLGIPPEEQVEIFKPFHQGSGAQHEGGTGLGLAIAQRQVELLGGKLELQSERGIGSRFHFQIPLTTAAIAEETATREITRLAKGMRVRALVVDDRQANRDVLAGLLTSVGCEVVHAVDGEEALRSVQVERPDIVFLDLLLPGISGAETARQLLAQPTLSGLKIVALTASALSRHRDEALAAGCVDFMAKPFRCERLYDCLQKHLGVQFEYAVATESGLAATLVAGQVALPDELYVRLTIAAELHSTTALKACLQDLRVLGPDAQTLAEHVRQLMRSYDMDGILRLLARVTIHNAAPANQPATQGMFAS